MSDPSKDSFEQAGNEGQLSLLGDIWQMLMENKKCWLIPLILGLLVFGQLIVFSGTAAAPFIYTLF